MGSLVAAAEETLLRPADLRRQDMERALGRLAAAGADLGEAFFQSRKSESWALEDGKVRHGSFSVDRGVGVRAVSGEKTGAAYVEDIRPQGFESAVEAACAIVRSGASQEAQALQAQTAQPIYEGVNPIPTLGQEDKVALLSRIDRAARRMDNRVQEVSVHLSLSFETVLVMATDGVLAADARPMARLDVSVIVVEGKRRERGYAGGGGRRDLSAFSHNWPEELAQEAVRCATVNLDAVEAPAGAMPVVLGPGWPGVLLHEAVGHGLEGGLQPQGRLRFRQPYRRAGRLPSLHRHRRRHPPQPTRFAQH